MHSRGEFKKLLLALFISQVGSYFLTLALSAFIFISTGSSVQASLVFVVSFLPSIFVSASLGSWVDRKISNSLLAKNELMAALSSVLCGICINFKFHLAALCIVLAFRSILMFIAKSGSTKWIKLITPPELQTSRFKLFSLSFFLSTAFAGILVGVVMAKQSIDAVILIDVLTYFISAAIMMTLQKTPAGIMSPASIEPCDEVPSLSETLLSILKMPMVRTSFLIVCFSQAIFQGAYSVLVSYLPIKQFSLGASGMSVFQIAASMGITGGFLIVWMAPKIFYEKSTLPIRTLALATVAISALRFCVSSNAIDYSVGSFFILNLAYECVWLHSNSEFFRASSKNATARHQFTLSACAAFLMSASTLAYSVAIEYFGLQSGVALVSELIITSMIFISIIFSKSLALPSAVRTSE